MRLDFLPEKFCFYLGLDADCWRVAIFLCVGVVQIFGGERESVLLLMDIQPALPESAKNSFSSFVPSCFGTLMTWFLGQLVWFCILHSS
jgi:hypothetical protein